VCGRLLVHSWQLLSRLSLLVVWLSVCTFTLLAWKSLGKLLERLGTLCRGISYTGGLGHTQ